MAGYISPAQLAARTAAAANGRETDKPIGDEFEGRRGRASRTRNAANVRAFPR